MPPHFDNPTGEPLDEDGRRYQMTRGKGDGRRPRSTQAADLKLARRAEPGDQVLYTDATVVFLRMIDSGPKAINQQAIEFEHVRARAS